MDLQNMYRPVKALSQNLRSECIIYFEENEHIHALAFLKALLLSNNDSTLPQSQNPAFLPSPHILALIATLAVHPTTTSRAATPELREVADLAVDFIDSVNHIVSPINANFRRAFFYPRAADTSLGRVRNRFTKRQSIKREGSDMASTNGTPVSSGPASPALHSPAEEEDQDKELISLKIANAGGLYARAEGFWHTVGWALNCSIRHTERWERWKLWLGITLDMLERDWTQRLRLARSRQGELDACVGSEELQESMIMMYLGGHTVKECRTQNTILRAIFADGGATSMAEFGEVFHKECELRKKSQDNDLRNDQVKNHKSRLDIDGGNFGDYFDDEEEEEQDNRAETTKRETERLKNSTRRKGMRDFAYWNYDGSLEMAEESDEDENPAPQTIEQFGGLNSVALRRRLLALLAHVATYLPNHFTSLPDLLDLYTEITRPLPISIFAFLVSPSPRMVQIHAEENAFPFDFDDTTLACFHEMLLRSLLSRSSPSYDYRIPHQRVLQSSYLPQASNSRTLADRAQLTLVLEALTRLLWRNGLLEGGSGALKRAHQRGASARKERVAADGKRKRDMQKATQSWAENAEKSLEVVINMVEMKPSIVCK